MNDARRKEIQRAVTLIEEAKDILEVAQTQEQDDFDNMSKDLQDGDEGLRAEEAVDALERAVTCCDDAISACADALQS
jgi:Ran GTPase-activating protein (RanGAP) involved in mRNA processing and transport